MKIGVSTKSFGGMTTEEAANLFEKSGIDCAELIFCQTDLSGWRYDAAGGMTLPDAETLRKAVGCYRKHGVEILSLGLYSNLWSGGDDEQYASMRTASEYCNLCAEAGIGMISTHGGLIGTLPVRQSFDGALCTKLLTGLSHLCMEAAKYGIRVALEPSPKDALPNLSAVENAVRQVTGRIGAAGTFRTVYTLADGEQMPPKEELAFFRIKDKDADGRFYERFGAGCTDWQSFFEASSSFGLPYVMEYVNSGNLAETAEALRRCLA